MDHPNHSSEGLTYRCSISRGWMVWVYQRKVSMEPSSRRTLVSCTRCNSLARQKRPTETQTGGRRWCLVDLGVYSQVRFRPQGTVLPSTPFKLSKIVCCDSQGLWTWLTMNSTRCVSSTETQSIEWEFARVIHAECHLD
jgi:hypothetical protein